MIVPDASVVVLLFGNPEVDSRVGEATRVLRGDPDWLVPEHWRIEFLSSVRGLAFGGKIDPVDADDAVRVEPLDEEDWPHRQRRLGFDTRARLLETVVLAFEGGGRARDPRDAGPEAVLESAALTRRPSRSRVGESRAPGHCGINVEDAPQPDRLAERGWQTGRIRRGAIGYEKSYH